MRDWFHVVPVRVCKFYGHPTFPLASSVCPLRPSAVPGSGGQGAQPDQGGGRVSPGLWERWEVSSYLLPATGPTTPKPSSPSGRDVLFLSLLGSAGFSSAPCGVTRAHEGGKGGFSEWGAQLGPGCPRWPHHKSAGLATLRWAVWGWLPARWRPSLQVAVSGAALRGAGGQEGDRGSAVPLKPGLGAG